MEMFQISRLKRNKPSAHAQNPTNHVDWIASKKCVFSRKRANSAWALLALRSAPGSPSRITWQGRQSPADNAIARLEGKGFEYMVRRDKIIIGRNTSRERIDVNMGHSAFISRHHLEIYHQSPNFYLKCISKNGIFVDGMFVRNDTEPIVLPKSCTFRFPSTTIKLAFQSLVCEEPIDLKMAQVSGSFKPPTRSPQPVKDSCDHFRSQPQSPADTISAANSCPTSPRPSTRWHTSSRTQPNSPQSHHNNNNNIHNANNNNSTNNNNNNSNVIMNNAGYMEVFDQSFMDASEVILDTDGNTTVVPGSVIIDPTQHQHHHLLHMYHQDHHQANSGAFERSVSYHHHHHHHQPSTSATPININAGLPTSGLGGPTSGGSNKHHDDGKPPYSYAQLIVQAISAAPDKQLTLNGIYSYITRNYPYYKTADKGWQNSIRHNLSLNRYFVKVPRNQEEPGKGSFWKIETSNETKLLDQAYRRRRKRENSSNSNSNANTSTATSTTNTNTNTSTTTTTNTNTSTNANINTNTKAKASTDANTNAVTSTSKNSASQETSIVASCVSSIVSSVVSEGVGDSVVKIEGK